MKDRIPTYAGRVKLIPVPNQPNTYDAVRADEPVQEGTPLNKQTLLNSEVEEEYGLSEDATPSDVFLAIKEKLDKSVESGLRGYTTSNLTTSTKIVTLYNSSMPTLILKAGMIFMVDFVESNMMTNVSLNINGTGAYPIMVDNSTYTGSLTTYTGAAMATITYMFNGTHYVWLNTDFAAASASRIMGGTFTGQVAANSSRQTPSVSCLRNSKIIATVTNPTVNGEINWTYK